MFGMSNELPRGVVSVVAGYLLWGVLPLFWDLLTHVGPSEVTLHRVLWGAVIGWIWTWAVRRRSSGRVAVTPLWPDVYTTLWLAAAGALLTLNWLVFVFAVTTGRRLDASLGYYINPLVNVLLGMVFLHERLSRLQWTAVAAATVGVAFLTVRLGMVPWISLFLAVSFGFYGLLKKRNRLGAIHALSIELTPFALVAALLIATNVVRSKGHFGTGSPVDVALLLATGVVTVVPLLLFGYGARRITLADLGFLQYLAPSIMFVLAITVFDDPLEPDRLVAFAFVWAGLALYSFDAVRRRYSCARTGRSHPRPRAR